VYVTNAVLLKGFYMTTLTTEEIILMWQTARFERNNIEEFARMVEAKAAEREREAILDLVDAYAKNNTDLADAIRARGQHDSNS
jgi:hypothetical protein